jgi:hypothetical protein
MDTIAGILKTGGQLTLNQNMVEALTEKTNPVDKSSTG